MNIKTQSYVTLSDLFLDCPTLKQMFHDYEHSAITWGNNNRSLTDVYYFNDWLGKMDDQEWVVPSEEIDLLNSRLDFLCEAKDCLIDLEN